MMAKLTLPIFDDEDDEFSSRYLTPIRARQLPQAALVLGDDDNADDAVGYGFAVPPHLLQPLPRFRIDLHLPLAISLAPHGLLERELGRNQGAALLGDFDFRHRSRNFSGPVPAAWAAIARPREVSQLNRSNLCCNERRVRPQQPHRQLSAEHAAHILVELPSHLLLLRLKLPAFFPVPPDRVRPIFLFCARLGSDFAHLALPR